jgi:hypothetical protein
MPVGSGPVGFFDHDARARAIERLRRQMWQAVVERFRKRQAEGLRQADLVQQLGISPPHLAHRSQLPHAEGRGAADAGPGRRVRRGGVGDHGGRAPDRRVAADQLTWRMAGLR